MHPYWKKKAEFQGTSIKSIPCELQDLWWRYDRIYLKFVRWWFSPRTKGPFYERFYNRNSHLMESWFWCNSIARCHITKKFCTTVVACAKFHSNDITTWMRAEWNFHQIWITMENLFVKWAPGLISISDKKSYLKILQSLEPPRLGLRMPLLLWNTVGGWTAVLLRYLPNVQSNWKTFNTNFAL